MKGIILAGGKGTRLLPLTEDTPKPLIHVNDLPMILYPLSTLLSMGITDILIITPTNKQEQFHNTISHYIPSKVNINYLSEGDPKGIGNAFILGAGFIEDDSVALILCDNFFYGNSFIHQAYDRLRFHSDRACIFGYQIESIRKLSQLGVAAIESNKLVDIYEKPIITSDTTLSFDTTRYPNISDYCIPGLYIYPNSVVEIAIYTSPSKRGEIEITDINREYIRRGEIDIEFMNPQSTYWNDMGTHETLAETCSILDEISDIKVGHPARSLRFGQNLDSIYGLN